MSIDIHDTSRHHPDMTEGVLKLMITLNKTNKQKNFFISYIFHGEIPVRSIQGPVVQSVPFRSLF